ncbi:related to Lactobacillus putative histidine protein kinase SppK [Fusarium fujikuroi]|nr:Lactobacillus putative histidine protein kinase SppK [Fusarium fujikuroi]KLP19605.1 Lactobacillus putative histidine protein kinase SppK [Fusarium fujikuroi]SCN90252.1 related to Lactobacillus putative histidine protein kinase SppK [Fusarium fujikuroi]SCO07120.1 related to Lactobacillus putative histidine protein kinase SppK [Fusarium fujikuroi]SCO18899.1 related to Lactobacillus putative histidine protein kinase SppK [Fusarium fujikuroi]
MARSPIMKTVTKRLRELAIVLWVDTETNDLWKQIIKCSIASIGSVVAVMTPQAAAVLGPSTFLAPMATVFAHPGQRLGPMIETLLMMLLGTLFGLAWSIVALRLSMLATAQTTHETAHNAICAVFFTMAAFFHGYVRSASPRMFLFVTFFLIANIITLLGGYTSVSSEVITHTYYPMMVGGGISIVVNLSIFPELSSSYLGVSAIDALIETMDTVTRATHWFITPGADSEEDSTITALTMTNTVKSVPEKPKRKKGRFRKWLSQFPNPFKQSQHRYHMSTTPVGLTTIKSLIGNKGSLRARHTHCKAAQKEVNYEISVSALPLSSMKPLTTSYMSSLVQNTVNIIAACENKFIVLQNNDGTDDESDSDMSGPSGIKRMSTFDDYLQRVEESKPLREIEASSASLLESIIERIREPVQVFEGSLKEAVRLVIICVAYCYDVRRLPSGAPTPRGIHLQELDLRIDLFAEAIANFDASCSMELRRSGMDKSGYSTDFMPRMETFLISSFVLSLRQAAKYVLEMLRHVRQTVEQRQARNDRATIWFPKHVDIRQWLISGGESDGFVLPEAARKEVRRGKSTTGHKSKIKTKQSNKDTKTQPPKGKDEEKGIRFAEPVLQTREDRNAEQPQEKGQSQPQKRSKILKIRGMAADALEWTQDSEHIKYAFKLTIAILLLSWPAFVESQAGWYSSYRGIWAPMQLFLVFEVAIGTSFHVFFIRLCGVVAGSAFGFASALVGSKSLIAMVFFLIIGIMPSFYVQLGTRYVKAGMISTVTMVVVALCKLLAIISDILDILTVLAAVNGDEPAYHYFYKRLCAFIVGGTTALLIELILYPVRARDRLVESVAASVKQVQNMQAAMAVGLDEPIKPDFRNSDLNKRFRRATNKARGALAAAETFLPFSVTEPRLKGDFKPLVPVYKEIFYVLHQIIDRMENVVMLRREYGSSILEDLNPQVHAYRRNVAASIMLTLFTVYEAFITWTPLPQFIPSSRLAQLRLVNHVREILASKSGTQTPAGEPSSVFDENGELAAQVAYLITQKRFLSWNASTSGQMEIIEYLEELVQLVKILVGVNDFRSGLLKTPTLSNYRERKHLTRMPLSRMPTADSRMTGVPAEEVPTVESRASGLQRTQTIRASHTRRRNHRRDGNEKEAGSDGEEELPMSLQRVGTRLCEDAAAARRRKMSVSRA